MKKMKNTKKYSDRELEEIASALSGELQGQPGIIDRFLDEEKDIVTGWNEMKKNDGERRNRCGKGLGKGVQQNRK